MSAAAEDKSNYKTLNVIQGEYAVSADPTCMMTTVLGSCVATCMYDPIAHVGGMNHFLLPGSKEDSPDKVYGLHSMELLINGLLKQGALRSRLEAKIFGGARMMAGLSDVGAKNTSFAREFLAVEKIPCVGESLGGEQGRRIRFWPTTGQARQMLLGAAKEIDRAAKPAPIPVPAAREDSGDLELF